MACEGKPGQAKADRIREANAVSAERVKQADELTQAALERLDKVADGVDDVEWGELTPAQQQAPIHVHVQQPAQAIQQAEADQPIPLISRVPRRLRGVVVGIILTLAALGLVGRDKVAALLDALWSGQ